MQQEPTYPLVSASLLLQTSLSTPMTVVANGLTPKTTSTIFMFDYYMVVLLTGRLSTKSAMSSSTAFTSSKQSVNPDCLLNL